MSTVDGEQPGYYNDMGLDTLWTGDLLRSIDISVEVIPPIDVEELDARRRGYERYDVSQNQIRVTFFATKNSSPSFGVMGNTSVTGMWVHTDTPLPFRSEVTVEWSVMGFAQTFPGRVVRRSKDGMAIHLDTNDDTWRFRSCFIDVARTPSADAPSVTVRPRVDEREPEERDHSVEAELRGAWDEVVHHLEDDDLHQAFIHECLRTRRLQFGLECYRELKAKYPDSEIATKYLQQIGTILSFYTLQSKNGPETESKRKLFPIVAFVIVVIALLLLAPVVMRQKMDRPVSAAPEVTPSGFIRSPPSP